VHCRGRSRLEVLTLQSHSTNTKTFQQLQVKIDEFVLILKEHVSIRLVYVRINGVQGFYFLLYACILHSKHEPFVLSLYLLKQG
jgi:hypothetical protein